MLIGSSIRIVSTIILLSSFGLIVCIKKYTKIRWIIYIILAVLVTLFALKFGSTDFHPPARTMPWFVSTLFFGINSLAFRLAGLISLCIFLLYFYIFLEQETKLNLIQKLAFTFIIGFIPTVFHSSILVESSIFAFITNSTVLILGYRFINYKKIDYLIVMGLVIGIGTLLRQTSIVMWILPLVLFTFSEYRFKIKYAIQIFFSGFLCLPYFLRVYLFGAFQLESQDSLLYKLYLSISTGIAPLSIINSTGFVWSIFIILGIGYLLFRYKKIEKKEVLLFLAFIPLYVEFYNTVYILWGAPRYQAEYVAPFILLLIFFIAKYAKKEHLNYIVVSFVFISLYSLETDKNLQLDTSFKEQPQARIRVQISLPYKEALGYVKKQDVSGKFALIGGVPIYSFPLWQSGFSFLDTRIWEQSNALANSAIGPLVNGNISFKEYCAQLVSNDIYYILTHSGSKLEFLHRPPHLDVFFEKLNEELFSEKPSLRLVKSYEENDGTIDIYLLEKNNIPNISLNSAIHNSSNFIRWQGFSTSEQTHRWSDSKKAEMQFNIDNLANAQGKLSLNCFTLGEQSVKILLNEIELVNIAKQNFDGIIEIIFEPSLLKNKKNVISFELPDARMPNSGDNRKLAIAIREFKIE